MKPVAWRLAVTAVLFLGWVGYLAYLALFARNPIVLSRPQFLVSDFDVVAHRAADDSFVVDEVLYPREPDKQPEGKGATIGVANLNQCQIFSLKNGGEPVPPEQGRSYLLALRAPVGQPGRQFQSPTFEVVPIPASPGYPPRDAHFSGPPLGPPRIYPADPAVLSQYHSIPKP